MLDGCRWLQMVEVISAAGIESLLLSYGDEVMQQILFPSSIKVKMRLRPKISETVKGKLSLGARIVQVGGVEKIFKQLFSIKEGEKLLKACRCYLLTTAGPTGLLFISKDKVAFCNQRSLKFYSSNGELLRLHLQGFDSVEKIKRVNQNEDMKKPSQKYMEITTLDN
ncbi:hypothetical protein Dsin_011183 [Dipteronia sinensis]|uniref:GRAM domain-containing protein n=1 Tax=Dipteronia sinensis TaxID=43782 RepID=A0AAE0ATX1_9ROSI|nr:hypothetical protein Dsin_011183 [Dipteronia sinensis]